VPVIIELFSSEGCSGCAALEKNLADLQAQQAIAGVELIALDEHVDNWSSNAARDPFVLRAVNNRHAEYARVFQLDSVYTPQVVVHGQTEFPGQQLAKPVAAAGNSLADAIAHAAKGPTAKVEVEFQSASVAIVRVDRLPQAAQPCDIVMAVTEDKLESTIAGGESDGQTLRHSPVVRSMVNIGRVDSTGPVTYNMHLRFNPRWKREDLRYVVFVQDRASRRIWGATAVTP
jgi:hypothetical protein